MKHVEIGAQKLNSVLISALSHFLVVPENRIKVQCLVNYKMIFHK
jgi:hypothetical protein